MRRRGADEMAVLGVGLCTPLGLTARATQVEIAAGTVRFFETDVMDGAGEPVRASMLTLLEPELTRSERMSSLAVTALQGAMSGTASLGIEQLPLLLALPEPGSGSPFDLPGMLEVLDSASAPVRLEVSEETLFPEGRAGFFRALAEASRLLKSRKVDCLLVGGVDSMCDRDSLAHQARERRTLGPRTRDGIIPGEGAGFFLLASDVPPLTVSLVAESLGDVGAAGGAIQLGSALYRLKKREPSHGDATRMLIYGCADAGHVGACVLEGGRG